MGGTFGADPNHSASNEFGSRVGSHQPQEVLIPYFRKMIVPPQS